MATVSLRDVTVQYPGSDTPSVKDFNLDIADGEFIVLVGPSGCGKSTSLRTLAGLEMVTQGTIDIDGRDVTDVPASKRDVAMVFQNYALYPNMTVAENMGFALRNAGVAKGERHKRVLEAAKMLELEDLLDRKPGKLSGGQRQRVAMGRAIVRRPKVFAMDEPLSNLDARLRVSTRSQIFSLQRRLGVTTVYVTHDQVEAMTMGDRVVVLRKGEVQQIAAPRELYRNPINTFVAGFIGSPGMNLIHAVVDSGQACFGGAHLQVPDGLNFAEGHPVTVGLRPESFELVAPQTPGAVTVRAELVEELGSESLLHGTTQSQDSDISQPRMVARVSRTATVSVGETVGLKPLPSEVYFFDANTGHRIGS